MIILQFFHNIGFHNIVFCFVILYLLFAFTYASQFSNCDIFDRPLMLSSYNFFSVFFTVLIFSLFCFDFVVYNKLYFFNQNIQLLFLIFMIGVMYASYDFSVAKNLFKFEYDLLFIFIILGSLCLCFYNDFLLIYLVIEIQSLTLYVFATFHRKSEFATEAGLKYFIFGSIMSCFLLFGFGFIYLLFGSISFEVISSFVNFQDDALHCLGFFFVLIVLLFKIGAVPFHIWLCDIYDGSILPVTLLFASAPKIVLFGLLFKLCFFVFFDYSNVWSILLGGSAVFSIIVGSISAIYQRRLKRLFGYSTIAHTGFILLAFLCYNVESSKALIFYIIIYSCLTVLTFSLLINMGLSNKIQPKYLINLSATSIQNPIFAAVFSLNILAVAGIPPLAGFFNKFFILLAVIGSEYYLTALMIILFSSIACFYYIRLVKIIYFSNSIKNTFWFTNATKQNTDILIGSLLFLIICYVLYPNLILNCAACISLALF